MRAYLIRASLAAGAAVAAFVAAPAASAEEEERKTRTRGWLESAILTPTDLMIDAKLDTGAKTSSIDAEILRAPGDLESADSGPIEPEDVAIAALAAAEEEEDEEEASSDSEHPMVGETVVFRVSDNDSDSEESRTFSRPIVRFVEIKNKTGGTVARPVVEMTFCVAGVMVEGEVTLADRSNMNYPLLIGRNMLMQAGIVVDSRDIYTRRKRTVRSRCAAASEA